MKVKCINIYNEHNKQHESFSSSITIGREYIVLEVEIYPGKNIFYRLISDNSNNSPALYDSKQFEIVSDQLSSNWIISQSKRGVVYLGPAAWQISGFWENCYDGDGATLEIYKREARIIVNEEE